MPDTALLLPEGFTNTAEPSAPKQFRINQAPYLQHNWSQLQAFIHYQGSYRNFVKVDRGVVTLNNGRVIIRFYAGCPDGWYEMDGQGYFISSEPEYRYPWKTFPDIDILTPKFYRMHKTPLIPRETIRLCLDYLNELRACNDLAEEDAEVFVDNRSFVEMRRRQDSPPREFSFGVDLPIRGDQNHGMVFHAAQLRIVMTEMIRYDAIHIAFDSDPSQGSPRPLFFGVDWGNCALVFNKRYD